MRTMCSEKMKTMPERADPRYSRCIRTGCAGGGHQFPYNPGGSRHFDAIADHKSDNIPHINSEVIAAAHISANRRNPASNSAGRPKEQALSGEITARQDPGAAQIGRTTHSSVRSRRR